MELTIEEKKNKRKAAIFTFITAAVILLIMWWKIGYTYLDPPLPESGAIIEFGWTDDGFGDIESAVVNDQEIEEEVTQESTTTETVEEVVQEVATQDESVVETTTAEEKEEEVVVKPDPKPSDALQNAMENVFNTPSGGGNDGDKEGSSGNSGDPKGDPLGKGVFGSDGIGVVGDGGRYLDGSLSVVEKPREEGIVVLKIWVDRNGNFLRAAPDLKNSTTTSSYLINLARKSVRETAKFKADPTSPVEQMMRVAFDFRLE